ncbi:hypothetical protein GCK72_016256 [Caenorhabditis remanei]|uniref:C2H2-type domain-containing protein n=1 Tax=Caenorhabditis remanei TaxID=31234 RepID=A0A6A5GYM4_CAERE|nr:hypothetical protein GCK72_016256 [Caenorhabditis remanei]KAF1759789.1 hypothetical protein GCK72_016256 [Caenorhabditis remanei]
MAATQIEIESYVIDQIRCPECAQTCLQKNIYRHMTQMHQWAVEDCKALVAAIRTEKKSRESKTSFVCSYCRVLFRSVRHLVQHKRICASQPHLTNGEENEEDLFLDEMIVEGEEEVGYPDSAQEDSEKPSTSSSFDLAVPPHRQTARPIPPHHLPPERLSLSSIDKPLKFPLQSSGSSPSKFPLSGRHRGSHLKCPECTTTAESLEEFIAHCREKHESADRMFTVERRLFDSKEEFKKWFDQRQEDTCTSLTKRTGHGGETLYRCHRVGKYRSVAKSRKSNPRKIDQTCTAYLKVTTDETGNTWVNGCFTHIGHDLDHKLLWLTETQENYVRELIDLSWSSDQIFFYIRNEYRDYECKLKYVSKNDIRNITVRYNREKEKLGWGDRKPDKSLVDANSENQEQSEDPKQAENREETEENEVKSKIPRIEKPEDVGTKPVEHSEDVAKPAEEYVEDDAERNPDEPPSGYVMEEIVEGEEVDPCTIVTEEEEYINVVDDDSMPELEKIN